MGCTEILLTPRGTQLACSIHDQHPAGHWAKHPCGAWVGWSVAPTAPGVAPEPVPLPQGWRGVFQGRRR